VCLFLGEKGKKGRGETHIIEDLVRLAVERDEACVYWNV
jgi:hypothetical protein